MLPDWLASLPDEITEQLRGISEELTLRDSKPIFDEGSPADKLYIVSAGYARLFRVQKDGSEVTLLTLPPGEIFGEAALEEDAYYCVFSESLLPSRVLAFEGGALRRLQRNSRELRFAMLRALAGRLERSLQQYKDIRFSVVVQRIARLLLEHKKPGRRGVEVNLSHRQIGYMVGVQRDTASRALSSMALSGLIENNYRNIVVLDEEKLRKLADF